MTSAFGGQHSIQLSYGRVRGSIARPPSLGQTETPYPQRPRRFVRHGGLQRLRSGSSVPLGLSVSTTAPGAP